MGSNKFLDIKALGRFYWYDSKFFHTVFRDRLVYISGDQENFIRKCFYEGLE